MPIFFRPLIAVLLGILLFGIGAEVASRIIFRQVVCFDVEMWRYAREIKAVGLTPGLRFEHRPDSQSRLMGVDVVINSSGLREREIPIPRIRPVKVVRIAAIGDSVTLGWGVPQDQTYPRQLESLLNTLRPLGADVSFEVINFGVGNYAIADVAAMLERKVVAYSPDLVIYGAFINDAESTVARGGAGVLQSSIFAVWLWGRLDALWRQWGWREDFMTYYNGLYREGGPGRSRVDSGLKKMAEVAAADRFPLVVAMLPELHEEAVPFFQPVRRLYRERAVANGAVFLDLHEALPAGSYRRFWVSADDAHPNSEACRLFAEYLAENVPWKELLRQRNAVNNPTDRNGSL